MEDQPPVYHEGESYEKWRASVIEWRRYTTLNLKRQALAVRAKLAGNLREVALKLDAGDLNEENGMEYLLEKLDSLFRKEKRRKWDVVNKRHNDNVGDGCFSMRDANQSAAERARLRAAELSAKLAAEGKYQAQPMSILPPLVLNPMDQFNSKRWKQFHMKPVHLPEVKKVNGAGYIAEFDINHLKAREFLMKPSTHDLISRQSGTMVFLQGSYLDPQQRLFMNGKKPLTIVIQGDVAAKVQVALHKISQVITNFEKHGGDYSSNNYGLTADLQATNHFVQDKVFVGLDNIPTHAFDVKKALTGENGENFNFIIQQTGAKIFLRGRRSGYIEPSSGRESFEALHIYISHPRQDGLESARQFCRNLIDTVLKKYDESVRVPPIHQSYMYDVQPGARGRLPVYPHIALESRSPNGRLPTDEFRDGRSSTQDNCQQRPRHGLPTEDCFRDQPRAPNKETDNLSRVDPLNKKRGSLEKLEEHPKISEVPKKKKRKFSEDPKLLKKNLSEQTPHKLQFRAKKEVGKESSTMSSERIEDIFKAPVAPLKSGRPSKLRIGALSSLIAYGDDSDSDSN